MKKLLLPVVTIALFSVQTFAQNNVGIGTNTPNSKLDVVGDINSSTGYKYQGTAPVNQFLRSNGTTFIPSLIQAGDLPAGSGNYIQNGNALQTGNFRIDGNGSLATLGIGVATPDASAALDITSTAKGMLFPRMTKAQRDVINSPTGPAPSLVIYQTDNTPGIYINMGTAVIPNWQRLTDAATGVGGITANAPLIISGSSTNPVISLGVVPVTLGGTGLTGVAAGQILVGNGPNSWINTNLGSGTGISIVSSAGSVVVTNTAPDQTVVLSNGTGISVTGTYPSFTVTNTAPSLGGTVTSISTGTGLTGGPITGSGTISLANTAVTPGSYTNANITVDAQGRVTAATNGSGGGSLTNVTASNGLTATPSGTVVDVKLGGTLTAPTDVALNGQNLTFSGTGNVGIGTSGGTQKLAVAGAIEIGTSSTPSSGAIRWNSTTNDFEGFDGQVWMSVTGLINRSNIYMDDGF